MTLQSYIIRAFLKKIKRPRIGCFVKNAIFFKKKYFLDLNKKYQKQNNFQLEGIRTSTYPSA